MKLFKVGGVACLLNSVSAVRGPLSVNNVDFSAVKVYASEGSEEVKTEVYGQTGVQKVGSGESQSLVYQFALVLESFVTSESTSGATPIPVTYGLLWSMPDATSIPHSKSMQAGVMLQTSGKSN